MELIQEERALKERPQQPISHQEENLDLSTMLWHTQKRKGSSFHNAPSIDSLIAQVWKRHARQEFKFLKSFNKNSFQAFIKEHTGACLPDDPLLSFPSVATQIKEVLTLNREKDSRDTALFFFQNFIESSLATHTLPVKMHSSV